MSRFPTPAAYDRSHGPAPGSAADGIHPGSTFTGTISKVLEGGEVEVTLDDLSTELDYRCRISPGLGVVIGQEVCVIFDSQKIPWVVTGSLPSSVVSSSANPTAAAEIPVSVGSSSQAITWQSKPMIDVRDYGAKGDGITDDTAAIKAAIAALGGNGGILLLPYGTYLVSGELDLHGKRSITVMGEGGLSGGAVCASYLKFTGEGERFINARSSYGFRLQDVQVIASSASFTGKLIDLSHDPTLKTDSELWRISGSYLEAKDTTTAVAVYLDKAVSGSIDACNIVGGKYGVQGVAEAGSYSNAVAISKTRFSGQGTASVFGPAQGWAWLGCGFEALASGAAGGIMQGFASGTGGEISGCWFGDVNSAQGGVQIQACAAYAIHGNYIGGSTHTTAIEVIAGAEGGYAKGNTFEQHEKGIAYATNTVTDFEHKDNHYLSVTTPLPAIAVEALAGAGTGATVSVNGNDNGFSILLTTGEPTGTGAQCKITLPCTRKTIRPVCCGGNARPWGTIEPYLSVTTSTITINFNKAPAAKTAYEMFVQNPIV